MQIFWEQQVWELKCKITYGNCLRYTLNCVAYIKLQLQIQVQIESTEDWFVGDDDVQTELPKMTNNPEQTIYNSFMLQNNRMHDREFLMA